MENVDVNGCIAGLGSGAEASANRYHVQRHLVTCRKRTELKSFRHSKTQITSKIKRHLECG